MPRDEEFLKKCLADSRAAHLAVVDELMALSQRLSKQRRARSPGEHLSLIQVTYRHVVAFGLTKLFGVATTDQDGVSWQSASSVTGMARMDVAGGTGLTEMLGRTDVWPDQPEDDLLLGALRIRMDVWAALTTLRTIERPRSIKPAESREYDAALDVITEDITAFDAVLQQNKCMFLPLVGIDMVKQWRDLLVPPYDENPWWVPLDILTT